MVQKNPRAVDEQWIRQYQANAVHESNKVIKLVANEIERERFTCQLGLQNARINLGKEKKQKEEVNMIQKK